MLMFYLCITGIMILTSILLASEEEYRKLSARVALCSLVWPLALVWLVLWVIYKLFVIAGWTPKDISDTKEVHLFDPGTLPVEGGGMRLAANPIKARPMSAIPTPPTKGSHTS